MKPRKRNKKSKTGKLDSESAERLKWNKAELKVFNRIEKSGYGKYISRKRKALTTNPTFRKELKAIENKFPYPRTDKEAEKRMWDRFNHPEKYKRVEDFCNRWGLVYPSYYTVRGAPNILLPIKVGRNDKSQYSLTPLNNEATRRYKTDMLSLLDYFQARTIGKVTAGRKTSPSTAKIRAAIYEEYHSRRKKKEWTYKILRSLKKKYPRYSDLTIERYATRPSK
ncbi:MAG: hypothetical protein WC486_00190 [Candidatus Omnitrophota bacterium]